jgi:hypothetical protein
MLKELFEKVTENNGKDLFVLKETDERLELKENRCIFYASFIKFLFIGECRVKDQLERNSIITGINIITKKKGNKKSID